MAKSRPAAARRDADLHEDEFNAGDVLDISPTALTPQFTTGIPPQEEETTQTRASDADASTHTARAEADSETPSAASSPKLGAPASPLLSLHLPYTPSSPSSPTLPAVAAAATPSADAVNTPTTSIATPPTSGTPTTTTGLAPFLTVATDTTPLAPPIPASFNTQTHIDSNSDSEAYQQHISSVPAPSAAAPPTAAATAVDSSNTLEEPTPSPSVNIPPMPTSPPPPPPIISPNYPFGMASASASGAGASAMHHHPLSMHTRVNSSAEDWTPEAGSVTATSQAMRMPDLAAYGDAHAHGNGNGRSGVVVTDVGGEGEQTLVEGMNGHSHSHRRGESSGSAAKGLGKGHTPKGVSQSSARWDPLRGQEESEAGHDRDRTLLGDETVGVSSSRKASENTYADEDFLEIGDGEEQDVGVSLEKHLHANSTGRRGVVGAGANANVNVNAGEHRKAEVPPMHAARRASHLKLDIHPPSPPPWEVVDPPADNNATAVSNGGDYYSPTGSKFRTLQSSGPRTLIPKSSYYFGPPPPDSAYGTPPTGHIGIHHPREILRIERDYSCGEIIQFAPIYPLELEGRITPTHFLESINSINELLISAHSTRRAMFDNMLAIFSLQLSKLFLKSHFDREMLRLRKLIDELNASLYNPVGLNILYPRDVAFLYLEIEYY